jgi:hypothetical protein
VDLLQLALAAGPVGFTVSGGAVMPPWGWGGVIVGVLSLLVVVRKRNTIAALGPERAAGILDAIFAARGQKPEESDAYRAPATPPREPPPTGPVRVSAYRDGELVSETVLGSSGLLKLGRVEAAGHSMRLNSPEVSRVHAVLERTSDGISVIDLGSDTGTLVNGERIARTTLREGDRVEIGPFVLLLGDVPPPSPQRRTDTPSCPVCEKAVVVPLSPVPEEWTRVGLEADHCLSCGHVSLKKSPRAPS